MVRLVEDRPTPFNKELVRQFTWHAASGASVTVISYGAIIQSVKVPDKNGELADIALGFDDVDGYVRRNVPYLGAAVGRCANRIGGAEFQIDGVRYTLAKNIGENHLHGGVVGFDKKNWNTTVDGNKVIFSYLSEDGEEGYPGDLLTNITYELTDDDQFHVEFMSTTTKKTVVNLTNHSYFNLAGHDGGAEELFKHVVTVSADKITETDHDSIPTGRLTNVGGTPFDLRIPKKLGDIISQDQTLFDNNFCVTSFGKQNLIDCSFYQVKDKSGCRHGRPMIDVFNYLCYGERRALGTEEAYPLTFDDEECPGVVGVRSLKSYVYNCGMDEDKLVEAVSRGPVTAVVDAILLTNYVEGVIDKNCEATQDTINHAVQIVGYDLTASPPYYIVRNSWGDDWGEKGYVRLAIGGNQCGITYIVGELQVF